MVAGGVDPDSFGHFWQDRQGSGPRVFYTMPDVHNPTGFRYSHETKTRIAQLARQFDVWIIEDDHLSELEPSGMPRFVDLVPERTFWIKSLSKTTAPGIRVCAIAVPEHLSARYAALRVESDPGPAMWIQLFIGRLISSGAFERHLENIQRVMQSRRENLRKLFSQFPCIVDAGGSAGYTFWLTGKPGCRIMDRHSGQPARTMWTEGSRFGSSPATRKSIRIAFMGIPESEWHSALRRLTVDLAVAFPDISSDRVG